MVAQLIEIGHLQQEPDGTLVMITPPWQIWHQWYETARWQRRRRHQLRDQPLCAMCLQHGLVVPATIADHVHAHRGDFNAFWEGELQSLCKQCHDGPKLAHEREQRRPYRRDVGADGWPTDPRHPANQPRTTKPAPR